MLQPSSWLPVTSCVISALAVACSGAIEERPTAVLPDAGVPSDHGSVIVPPNTATPGALLPATGDGGTGANPSTIVGCSGTSSVTEALHPVLEFLVDISLSMLEKAPGGTQTKWDATRAALSSAVTDMAEDTGFGLIYYPNMLASKGVCLLRQIAVPIAPLDTTVRGLALSSLRSARPNGMTPTHDAYAYALETIKATKLSGSKYIVLVTDGAPTFSQNCVGNGLAEVDTAPLVDAAAGANAAGVKTFVIGSPGSESARGALSRMATAGGTAISGCSDTGPVYCHFDMTTAPNLSAALNAAVHAITGRVISCEYPIPAPPAGMQLDHDLVNVAVTDTAGHRPILRDSSGASCSDGWDYSADNAHIVLCPGACNAVKHDPAARVDVVFGCRTESVQIR